MILNQAEGGQTPITVGRFELIGRGRWDRWDDSGDIGHTIFLEMNNGIAGQRASITNYPIPSGCSVGVAVENSKVDIPVGVFAGQTLGETLCCVPIDSFSSENPD